MTNKHLYPNKLERQKVQPAVDIFQPDITAALRTCTDMKLPGFDNIEETLRFLQLAGKWWNCHDVSSTTQYWRFNLPEKMPYYDSNDERLDFLCKDVPKMLEEIQQAAKTVRENKKAKSLEKKEQINLWVKLHQDMNSTEKERVKREIAEMNESWKKGNTNSISFASQKKPIKQSYLPVDLLVRVCVIC